MLSKTIEQILYVSGPEQHHEEMKRQGYNLKDYPTNPSTVSDVNKINETLTFNLKEIDRQVRKKVAKYHRDVNKAKFKKSEELRASKFKIAGGATGAGVGGAVGYALSKHATRNTQPGAKRTAIRVGSTIAGAALGGYAGHYAGKKLALRGTAQRYKNYLKNK